MDCHGLMDHAKEGVYAPEGYRTVKAVAEATAGPRSKGPRSLRERMARTEETVLAWPATLMRDDEGRVQVRFPDFPEALTDADDEREALAEAADCLAEAVAARIADGEDIPAPTRLRRGMRAVPLSPVLAYKAALYSAMRRDGISKSELARRLWESTRRTCGALSIRDTAVPRSNGCMRRWPRVVLSRSSRCSTPAASARSARVPDRAGKPQSRPPVAATRRAG